MMNSEYPKHEYELRYGRKTEFCFYSESTFVQLTQEPCFASIEKHFMGLCGYSSYSHGTVYGFCYMFDTDENLNKFIMKYL